MAPSCASEPRPQGLALRDFRFTWPGSTRATLAGIDLHVAPGQCLFVGGASGSGKTTLLRALAGLLPGLPAARGRPAALLLQNVDAQLLASRVADEVDFGLSLRGLPAAERARRGASALHALGLAGFERRSVDDLSAGEKQRVVLAALLALEPGALLLDEPSSQLDPAGRARLSRCLRGLLAAGHAVVIADHRLEPWADLVDRHVVLKEGRLAAAPAAHDADSHGPPPPPPADAPAALSLQGVSLREPGGRGLLHHVSLQVAAGEWVQLCGPNGAGKSTLLRLAAGLVRPTAGRVRVGDGTARHGQVGLLFQNPERNLFERSVADEVAFALRRFGWSRHRAAERVRDVLARCGLESLHGQSPLRLSFGEQHRVALASVLAPRPQLLLLDEPFAGLDPESRARVLELLRREQRDTGLALLAASHDEPPSRPWVHRVLGIREGRL